MHSDTSLIPVARSALMYSIIYVWLNSFLLLIKLAGGERLHLGIDQLSFIDVVLQ